MGSGGPDAGREKKRRSGWEKGTDVLLRVAHVGATSVLFGGVVWGVSFGRLMPWHNLAIGTGAALIVAGICQSRHWPYQGRGLMALLHVGLLTLVHVRPDLLVPILSLVLIVGVVGSNMPGAMRHWSMLHRARVD